MPKPLAKTPGNVSKEIPPEELKQRVAVLRRFKELLTAQRERFRVYLESLDRQKDVIEGGEVDDLLRHVELEEKIMADIFSIQKVIDPLEGMFRLAGPGRAAAVPNSGDEEVFGLKKAIEGLKAEAALRSERNRALLSKRMADLRSEINTLKSNPYAARRFNTAASPTRIDIKG